MPTKVKQVLPYVVMLAVSAWLFWVSTRIDVDTGGRIGPTVWPRAVIVFMGLLCAYEIVKRLAFGAAGEAKGVVDMDAGGEGPGEAMAAAPAESHHWMLAGGIGLIALYVVLVPFTGFFFATALFLLAFPLVGGWAHPALAAVISAAGTLVLALVFLKVAYISLPLGVGPFRDLSIGLLRLLGVT